MLKEGKKILYKHLYHNTSRKCTLQRVCLCRMKSLYLISIVKNVIIYVNFVFIQKDFFLYLFFSIAFCSSFYTSISNHFIYTEYLYVYVYV